MEIWLNSPEFSKFKKHLQDSNGIPIGRAHDNSMLDTIIYVVEQLDGHKASLAANTIAEIYFHKLMKRLIYLCCLIRYCILLLICQISCSSMPSLFQIIEGI